MKRLVIVLLLMMVPTAALAQAAPAANTDGLVIDQGRPVLPPPPPPVRERRAGMVGYIEDAIVSSKIRVRFDTAFHDLAPDRAEFFYAKCGCYQGLPNEFHDPDAPGPQPGAVSDLNFQQVYIRGEYAGGGRVSVFAELPSRWIQPQGFVTGTGSFPNQAGLSDLRLGAKLALLAQSGQVATLQLQVYLPTGKAENGLGTHHQSLEPALLLSNRVTDRVAIESQVGLWHPFGGSVGHPTDDNDKFAGDVIFYGIGPSVEVYHRSGVSFGPVVELVGWRVLKGSQTGAVRVGDLAILPILDEDVAGTNIVNLKFGGRVSWGGGQSFYAGWGKALTDASWYESIFRMEYRFSF